MQLPRFDGHHAIIDRGSADVEHGEVIGGIPAAVVELM
jgi:hypothetical protein